jgi:microcystin-dependent protein
VSGRAALLDALDKHGERMSERNRSMHRGNVSKLKPLTIDVFDYDIPLTLDDDFELSQWMQVYQQAVGLRVADLVLMHQEQHDWTLVDVVSDADASTAFAGATGADGSPPGAVTMFSGKALPTGYVLCDGATYTQGAYPRGYAFAVIEQASGNPLWTANTSLRTFTVPDLRDRFILAAGARTLGVKSAPGDPTNNGEATHGLTVAELATHDHGGATSTGDGVGRAGMTGAQNQLHQHPGTTDDMDRSLDHLHNPPGGSTVFVTAGGAATGQGVVSSAGQTVKVPATTGGADRGLDHLHTFTTSTESVWHWHGLAANGSGAAHNNMPPYAVISLIVKVR